MRVPRKNVRMSRECKKMLGPNVTTLYLIHEQRELKLHKVKCMRNRVTGELVDVGGPVPS